MTVSEILSRLRGVRRGSSGWSARCPGHDDRQASLRVAEGNNGRVLVHCFAGCEPEQVVGKLGLSLADLMPERPAQARRRESGQQSEVICWYDYRDESGVLLFQVGRRRLKDGFVQRRPDGSVEWVYFLDGVRRVLYRLPELLAAETAGTVFIAEGEKDVDNLCAAGLIATCNPGGAGKWRAEYAETFRGRRVVVLPDKDDSGHRHAQDVAHSLHGVALSVKVLPLPRLAKKGDVSDWLEDGGTVEELQRLAAEVPEWEPSNVGSQGPLLSRSVAIIIRLSDVEPREVTWLWPGRIPFGKVTVIEGDPGLGKSMLALDLVARLTVGRELPGGSPCEPANAVIMSAEDDLADTIRPRLDSAGGAPERVVALTAVKTDDGAEDFPSLAKNLGQIEAAVSDHQARLVVIDPLMAYLGGGKDLDAHKDQHVRRVLAPLSAMASRTGAAVVVVRHLTKGGGVPAIYRGGGSIGISGAARSVLLVAKDPDDDERRIVAPVKCNLSGPSPSLAYRVEVNEGRRPFIAWASGTVDISADQLLAVSAEGEKERSAREEAENWLASNLADGSRPALDVLKEAKRAGHADRTVRRAAANLRIEKRKAGFDGGWTWSLPSEDGQTGPKVAYQDRGHLRGELAMFAPVPDGLRPCGYHIGPLSSPCDRCGLTFPEHGATAGLARRL